MREFPDYGFLSALPAEATGEGASFRGTAASVQDRATGLVLSLGAAGEVRYWDYGLAAEFGGSLRVMDHALTIDLPEKVTDGNSTLRPMVAFPGGTVSITAPGEWSLAQPAPGVRLTRTAAGWVLTVPAGVKRVSLAPR